MLNAIKYLKFFIIYTIFSNQIVKADNDTTSGTDVSVTNAGTDVSVTNGDTDVSVTNADTHVSDINASTHVSDTNADTHVSDTNADTHVSDTNTNDKLSENLNPITKTTLGQESTTEQSGNCSLPEAQPTIAHNFIDRLDFDRPKNVTAIYNYMRNLARDYPKQASLHEVGMSLDGFPIYALEIVYSVYTGATVVVDAGMVGTDRVGVNFALYLLYNLLELLSRNVSTLTGIKFVIIPLVNPDEYIRSFTGTESATCREPFHKNFDIGEPPQNTLCGSSKFLTEREVRDLASFYSDIKNFKLYLNVHSGINKIAFPFGYKKEIVDSVVVEMADNMRNVIDSKSLRQKVTVSSLNTIFGDHPGAPVDWVYEKLLVPYPFYISFDEGEPDRRTLFRAYYNALRYSVLQVQLTDPKVAKAIYRDCNGNQKVYANNTLIVYISLITMFFKIVIF